MKTWGGKRAGSGRKRKPPPPARAGAIKAAPEQGRLAVPRPPPALIEPLETARQAKLV